MKFLKLLLMVLLVNSIYTEEFILNKFDDLKLEIADTKSSIFDGLKGSSPLTGAFIDENISFLISYNDPNFLSNENNQLAFSTFNCYIKIFNFSLGYERVDILNKSLVKDSTEYIYCSSYPLKLAFEYENFIFGITGQLINSLFLGSNLKSNFYNNFKKELKADFEGKGFKMSFASAYKSNFGIFNISILNLFNHINNLSPFAVEDTPNFLKLNRSLNISYNNKFKVGLLLKSITGSLELNDLLNKDNFFSKVKINTEAKFRLLFLGANFRAGISNLFPTIGFGISLSGLLIEYDYSNRYLEGKVCNLHSMSINLGSL